jgi:hypothetical protein
MKFGERNQKKALMLQTLKKVMMNKSLKKKKDSESGSLLKNSAMQMLTLGA